MHIHNLPPELASQIAEELDSCAELSLVSQCSKTLHRLFLPLLYRRDHKLGQHKALNWAATQNFPRLLEGVSDAGINIATDSPATEFLSISVAFGSLEIMEALIRVYGVETNKIDSCGQTIMENAIASLNESVVKAVLAHGLSPSEPNPFQGNRCPLHFAIDVMRFNDHDLLPVLLDAGADIEALDGNGRSPLIFAAAVGSLKGVFTLLQHGAKITYQAIHHAAENDFADVVDALLAELDADINDVVFDGLNLLHVAVRYRCEGIARLFIHRGGDINAKTTGSSMERSDTKTGLTPILLAAENRDLNYNMTDITFKLADICLFAGADVSIPDPEGFLPVHRAVQNFDFGLVDAILNYGGDVNQPFPDGTTLSMWAVQTDKDHMLRKFIDHGADPNIKDADGQPLIYLLAKAKKIEALKETCARGANINERNAEGMNVLHCALQVDTLKRDSRTPLSNSFFVQALLKLGARVNAKDNQGKTPLHYAAANGDADTIDVLLKDGARLEAKDMRGLTPICYAIGHNYLAMKALLNKRANVNATTNSGQRLTMLAALQGADNTMDMLWERENIGSSTVVDNLGRTTLFYAVLSGNVSTFETALVQLGDNRTCPKDIYGTTPLMIAARNGHAQILERLLESIDHNIEDVDNFGRNLLYWAAASHNHEVWEAVCNHMGESLDWSQFQDDEESATPVEFARGACICGICGRNTVHPPHVGARACSKCSVGTLPFYGCGFCVTKGAKCSGEDHEWDSEPQCCSHHGLMAAMIADNERDDLDSIDYTWGITQWH